MVSQDVLEVVIFMLVFIIGGVIQVLSIVIIDKFRQKGPAHYLGVGMMQAWAWDAGDALRGGHVAGLPVNTKQLAELSKKRAESKAKDHIKAYTAATEEQELAQEAEILNKKREELAKQAEKAIPPPR